MAGDEKFEAVSKAFWNLICASIIDSESSSSWMAEGFGFSFNLNFIWIEVFICCHGAGNSQRFFEILLGAAYEYYYANSIILCSASNLHLQSKANSKHWSHSILFQSIPSTNMIGNNILMKEWGIFIYLVKLGLSCRTVGRRNFVPTEHASYVPVLAVLVKIQSLQPKN